MTKRKRNRPNRRGREEGFARLNAKPENRPFIDAFQHRHARHYPAGLIVDANDAVAEYRARGLPEPADKQCWGWIFSKLCRGKKPIFRCLKDKVVPAENFKSKASIVRVYQRTEHFQPGVFPPRRPRP